MSSQRGYNPSDEQGQDQAATDGVMWLRDDSDVEEGGTQVQGAGGGGGGEFEKGYGAYRFKIAEDRDEQTGRRKLYRDKDDHQRPFFANLQRQQVSYRRHHDPYGSPDEEADSKAQDHSIEIGTVVDTREKIEDPITRHGKNISTLFWGEPKKERGLRHDIDNFNENKPIGRSHDMFAIEGYSPGRDHRLAHNITNPNDISTTSRRAYGNISNPDNVVGVPYSEGANPTIAVKPPIHSGGFTRDHKLDLVSAWSMIAEHINLETAHWLKNSDGVHLHTLAIRHDAQFRRAGDHGRLFLTRTPAAQPPDDTTWVFTEIAADPTKANFDTSLKRETVEWRPIVPLNMFGPPKMTHTRTVKTNDTIRSVKLPETEPWGGQKTVEIHDPSVDTGRTREFILQRPTIPSMDTLRVVIDFSVNTTTGPSDDIVFLLDNQTIGVGDAEPGSFGSATETVDGTNQTLTADTKYTIIHNVTPSSPINPDFCKEYWVNVGRKGADAADTYSGKVQIHDVYLIWDQIEDPTNFWDGPFNSITLPSMGTDANVGSFVVTPP